MKSFLGEEKSKQYDIASLDVDSLIAEVDPTLRETVNRLTQSKSERKRASRANDSECLAFTLLDAILYRHFLFSSTQRFKSTRKKRPRKASHMLLKPSLEEIKRIKLDLSSFPIKNCSICSREDPDIHVLLLSVHAALSIATTQPHITM